MALAHVPAIQPNAGGNDVDMVVLRVPMPYSDVLGVLEAHLLGIALSPSPFAFQGAHSGIFFTRVSGLRIRARVTATTMALESTSHIPDLGATGQRALPNAQFPRVRIID